MTALSAGEQALNLLVTVRVFAGELGERGRDLPVITKGVQVRVDPVYSVRSFVGRYWQWLATTLLLPGAGWLVRSYAVRKKVQKEKKSSLSQPKSRSHLILKPKNWK